MTPGKAKLLILGAMLACSVVVYRRGGDKFDPRRDTSIAILGAALLFLASFSPVVAAGAGGLLLADALVLSGSGVSAIDAVGTLAVSGASTSSINPIIDSGDIAAAKNLFSGKSSGSTRSSAPSAPVSEKQAILHDIENV